MTKVEKLAILLGVVFFLLLNYPLLANFNRNILVAGTPLIILYLFIVWILAIVVLFYFARRFNSQA